MTPPTDTTATTKIPAAAPADFAANVRAGLLAELGDSDHWEGELSASAVSTAVAAMALCKLDPATYAEFVSSALAWLTRTANDDGGWGDTDASPSNLAATLLSVSAFCIAGRTDDPVATTGRDWLARNAGRCDITHIAAALQKQYGRDKTFAIPILTACKIAGFFGDDLADWKHIPALPFELGLLPHRLLAGIGLPVVSYALPALIAIGQVRHHHRRPGNPISRCFRKLAARPTLRRLIKLQPSGGGFLEAAPLTGFVTLALCEMGCEDHPVAQAAAEFLTRTTRADGSWPIDTTLRTWVTSLAATAVADELTDEQRRNTLAWLLRSQHLQRHPFTQAAPGGWGWCDLSGAVPDADDTAGALLAIRALQPSPTPETRLAAMLGVTWLLNLQNRDGGWPTFCKGWTHLPFDTSCNDLTAHTLAALAAWRDDLPRRLTRRCGKALTRGTVFLQKQQQQRADGALLPLWFGSQRTGDQSNPVFGTARVLRGLRLAQEAGWSHPAIAEITTKGRDFLLTAQHTSGGWGASLDAEPTEEETAAALDALTGCEAHASLTRGWAWLTAATDNGTAFHPSPIGLYFAKLWYHEKLYPTLFAAGACGAGNSALK